MNLLFWIIVAADVILLGVLLQGGLAQGGNSSGGREMAIGFFVILPAIVLAICILLFIYSPANFWRWFALFMVAVPGLLFGVTQVRNAGIDYSIAQAALGRGYFEDKTLNDLGAAVVACDTAALQRLAPGVDLNTRGRDDITLLGLAIERANENPECPTGSRLAVVRQLLALDANADAGLEKALAMKDIAFMTALLDAGANPNQLSKNNQPIVFSWLSILPVDNLRLLIDRGLDMNVSSYGNPLPFDMVINRRWDLLALAIERGADWRRARDDGRAVPTEIVSQIAELRKDGSEPPADLLRVQMLIDKSSSVPVH